MPKINVYVSDDLQARLRLHPEVEVSKTCQQALEAVLDGDEPPGLVRRQIHHDVVSEIKRQVLELFDSLD